MKKTLILALVSMFIAACGGAGTSLVSSGPGKVTSNFKLMGKDITKELEVKQGNISVLDIVPKTGSTVKIIDHEISLTNYEYDPGNYSDKFPKKDSDVMILIQLLADKDATMQSALKPGTYNAAVPEDGENVYGKAWHIMTKHFGDGKVLTSDLSGNYPRGTRKGTVKITAVTDTNVSGEIDISDDSGSVKGTFNAPLKKKN